MGIDTIKVSKLLAFPDLSLSFSPGINVIIGENATGKTHLMKLMYAATRAHQQYVRGDQTSESSSEGKPAPYITQRLLGLFQPDNGEIGRLLNRARGYRRRGWAEMTWNAEGRFRVSITSLGKVNRKYSGKPLDAVFLPSGEVLAMYPGFVRAFENLDLKFDETYYDVCKALSGATLRGPRGNRANQLLKPLLAVLDGRIVFDGSRFVLHSKRLGNLEAPLLSEGIRKLGVLAHLIANGSLTEQSVLFWDEPEASLNPKLITVVAKMLRSLAEQGTQVFLATHDFLLTQELSMAADFKTPPNIPVRFIALSRDTARLGVKAQEAESLAGLEDNAILAEFAACYDREQALLAHELGRGGK